MTVEDDYDKKKMIVDYNDIKTWIWRLYDNDAVVHALVT
jgi:hypothetical protein